MATKLCECGCGGVTPLARQTHKSRGWIKGEPIRFISGHWAPKPLLDRLMEKVVWNGDEDECWTWAGYKSPLGYGYISVKNRLVPVHRASYEEFVGPIPDGLEIDHLCVNPSCVNPVHLEPVTHEVNSLRSSSPPARNALKTHCKHGHEFTPENTYFLKDRAGRVCKTCQRRSRRKGAR